MSTQSLPQEYITPQFETKAMLDLTIEARERSDDNNNNDNHTKLSR